MRELGAYSINLNTNTSFPSNQFVILTPIVCVYHALHIFCQYHSDSYSIFQFLAKKITEISAHYEFLVEDQTEA